MKLFVFGLGYTARRFALRHAASFQSVVGTTRTLDSQRDLAREGLDALLFNEDGADPRLEAELRGSDALLVSVQPGQGPDPDRGSDPGRGSDPVLGRFAPLIADAPRLGRIVYLSTIGVYGDHGGAWIDETAPLEAANPRQSARIAAEAEWLELGRQKGVPAVVLRLAGIYGPGRNALRDLRDGDARRLDKPGQVFNRIHVDDIGLSIAAALRHGNPPAVVNVTDDEPAPAPDVVSYAATLMGVEPPRLIPFETATLSPMARSFYGANRRVSNGRLRERLGVDLRYPTYRAGLDALWQAGEGTLAEKA